MCDEVVIKLTNGNEPPQVFIGGKRVYVNSLDLNYKTDTTIPGTHDFHLLHLEKGKLEQIGFKR